MKKLLLSAMAAAFTFGSVQAQEPDFNVAPDFTVTDVNGNTHNLYSYLDQGKTVVLDLFATWCGPCWNYAGHPASSTHPNFGALEDLHAMYGPGGTDEVVVIAIESDGNTNMADLQGTTSGTAGDWITGTQYPIVDDASVAALFNLSYYPTIVMICPDRYAYEIGQSSVADFYAGVGTCPDVPTNANDPRVMGNTSEDIFCSGGEAAMSAVVQNYGTQNVTSMTIEVMDGSNSVLSYNWTGNLAPFAAEEINLGTVAPSAATTYSIMITSGNDDTSNDDIDAMVSPAPVLNVSTADRAIALDVVFDGYGSEFGFAFSSGSAPESDLFALYGGLNDGTFTADTFVAIGTFADGDAGISTNLVANSNGCHYIAFFDNYGDGLTYPNTGTIDLNGVGGSTMNVNAEYDYGTIAVFDVQNAVSVVEVVNNIANVYPNPANGQNVTVEVMNGAKELNITDVTGKLVYRTNIAGTPVVTIPTLDFKAGVYMINVVSTEGVSTQKLIIE